MPTSTLKINGTAVDRATVDITLERMLIGNPDGPDELQFTAHCRTEKPYAHRSTAVLEVDTGSGAVVRFRGRITSVENVDDGGPGYAYTAQGGAYLADLVSVSHPARGIGESPAYNAAPDDPDYDAGLVGLEVGEILEEILTIDRVATDLWNAGIEAYTAAPPYDTAGSTPPVLKSATLTDFAAMTNIPLSAVRLSGQRLWSQLLDIVRTHAPTFRLRVRGDGTIRCTDTRTLTPRTLTIGTDPIRIPRLSRDTTDCATAIRVRGRDDVEGMWFALAAGDLEADWTAVQEADWTWDDFVRPTAGYSAGTITAMGTNTVTVDPNDGLQAWGLNYWAPLFAHVTLIDDAASGNITYQITRRVVSNTALSTTSILTLDTDLPPSPAYDRFQLLGIAEGSEVHRVYKFATTRQAAAKRIVNRFPFPVSTASLGTGFDGAIQTSVPFGWNVRASSGLTTGQVFPLQFTIFTDPDDSLVKIITSEPTIAPWTIQSDRDLGGNRVTKPDDIRVFVPVSKGPLEVRVPSTGFEGRANTVDGLEFEVTIDLDGWNYTGDLTRAESFAQDLLDSLKDPVISGAIEYVGYDATAVAAAGVESIKLATATGFDGIDEDLDDVPLPVHSVEVRWQHSPGQPTTHLTVINVSNRTFPYHGERNVEPRGYTSGASLFGFGDAARSMGLFTGEE